MWEQLDDGDRRLVVGHLGHCRSALKVWCGASPRQWAAAECMGRAPVQHLDSCYDAGLHLEQYKYASMELQVCAPGPQPAPVCYVQQQ